MIETRSAPFIEVLNLGRLVENGRISASEYVLIIEIIGTLETRVFPGRNVQVSLTRKKSFDDLRRGEYGHQQSGRYGYGVITVLERLFGFELAFVMAHELTHAVLAQGMMDSSLKWDLALSDLLANRKSRKELRLYGKRWERTDPDYFERRQYPDKMRLEEYLCDQVANWVCREMNFHDYGWSVREPDMKILQELTAVKQ